MRLRPKRPILRAQLAAQNNPFALAAQRKPLRLTGVHGATRGANGEICWHTDGYTAKCCSYKGIALPFCVTIPDNDDSSDPGEPYD